MQTKLVNPVSLSIDTTNTRHKLNQGEKRVSVPQGIYELKEQLSQLEKIPPSEILANMQTTLLSKTAEKKPTLFFNSLNVL